MTDGEIKLLHDTNLILMNNTKSIMLKSNNWQTHDQCKQEGILRT